jgi:hypothetical protein
VNALEGIRVIPLGFNELTTLMVGHTDIQERYFSLRKVVDNQYVERIGAEVEKLARTFAEEEVRRLLDELNAVPRERRIDLGLFSLWGYPEAFLKGLFESGDFRSVGFALVEAKSQLDGKFVNYLGERISSEILANITARRQFSPITRSAATPYLTGRLLERWKRAQQGKVLSQALPRPNIDTDSASVRARILDLGRAFLQDDWSQYLGKGELLELKKQIARHTYGSFRSVEEMAKTFDDEWRVMAPIVDEIEKRIEGEIPDGTTIVIRELRWFDDTDYVRNLFESAKRFAPD